MKIKFEIEDMGIYTHEQFKKQIDLNTYFIGDYDGADFNMNADYYKICEKYDIKFKTFDNKIKKEILNFYGIDIYIYNIGLHFYKNNGVLTIIILLYKTAEQVHKTFVKLFIDTLTDNDFRLLYNRLKTYHNVEKTKMKQQNSNI
jgi:hypothetical protein